MNGRGIRVYKIKKRTNEILVSKKLKIRVLYSFKNSESWIIKNRLTASDFFIRSFSYKT